MSLSTSLRKSVSKLISGLRILVTRLTIRPSGDQTHVYLDLREPIRVKTFRYLFIFFASNQVTVYLHPLLKKMFFSTVQVLGWHPNVRIALFQPRQTENMILCTDQQFESDEADWDKVIHIRYDYLPSIRVDEQSFAFPSQMHPQIYVQYHDHERLDKYRTSEKKVRVLFAGNYDKGYENQIYQNYYHMLSRYEVLEHLKTGGLARVIDSKDQLNQILKGSAQHEFLFVPPFVRINQAEWLSLVAQADFFICPPGVLFPLSHNLVEAMAVGTIPITNYPHWLFPNLTSQQNCLTFSNIPELDDTIHQALSMSQDQVRSLQERVIAYYEQHLNPTCAFQMMMGSPDQEITLHMLEEQESFIVRAYQNQ